MDNDHEPIDTGELLENLTGRFDKEELRTLAFQVGVDWGDIAGETRIEKARELIAYLDRRGRLEVLVAAGVYGFLYLATTWNPYVVWLVALSITTGAMFLVDKMLAKMGSARIPEVVLHIFTFAGGFLGQWFGRVVARHKINSREHPLFRIVLIISIFFHLVLIYYWF